MLFVMLAVSVVSCQKDNIILIDPVEVDDSEDYITNTKFTKTVSVMFSTGENATVTGTNDDFTVSIDGNDVTIIYTGEEYVM